MRLASLPLARDGRLIAVSDDLAWYADADHIVPTMQGLLDAWDRYAPPLESLAIELAHGAIPRKRFHEREAAAPLPRAHHRMGGCDALHGARDALILPDETWNAAFAPAVIVLTGDVRQGLGADAARDCIELVGLANEIVLHDHPAHGSAEGLVRTACYASPVLATPDALGEHWRDGVFRAPITITRNGAVQTVQAVVDFGAELARLAATRAIGAGALIGVELALQDGGALRHGDTVRVEGRDGNGHSLFGAIEQKIVRY